MVNHRADEKSMKYKLKVYQKNFPNFVCVNPISVKTSGQDEEIKAKPNKTTQEQEVQTKEP